MTASVNMECYPTPEMWSVEEVAESGDTLIGENNEQIFGEGGEGIIGE